MVVPKVRGRIQRLIIVLMFDSSPCRRESDADVARATGRDELDQELAESKKPPIRVAVSESKRAKPAEPKKRLTEAEFQQHLLDIGLVTSLPDPSRDIADDDPEDQPVTIKGEPLSETILRDRR